MPAGSPGGHFFRLDLSQKPWFLNNTCVRAGAGATRKKAPMAGAGV